MCCLSKWHYTEYLLRSSKRRRICTFNVKWKCDPLWWVHSTELHVTWMAKLIITTTEYEKQKSMTFLCAWHSESEHMVRTSPSDCVCRTCPFLQKTPLRETCISACWNCLLMCKSTFSQMNTTALNVLQQSTATQTAEHTHTCTLAGGQHQNYVTCWTFPNNFLFLNINQLDALNFIIRFFHRG